MLQPRLADLGWRVWNGAAVSRYRCWWRWKTIL